MARLLRGEPVPPERVYFRTAPGLRDPLPRPCLAAPELFVGFGERQPDSVRVRIFLV